MTVTGIVYKLSGNYAQIKTPRPQACESCSNYSLCKGKDVDMKVFNSIGAKIGDHVEVDVCEDQRAIYIMAYLFLVPVALIFVGYALFTILVMLLFLLIPIVSAYFAGLYALNKRFKLKSEIIRITDPTELDCTTAIQKNKIV